MLKDATPSPNRIKRGSEASVIGAKLELMRVARAAMPEPAPTFAGRMRNDRMWPIVPPRIAIFVPWIDIGHSVVWSAALNEQRRDHCMISSETPNS